MHACMALTVSVVETRVVAGTVVAGTGTGTVCKRADVNDNNHIIMCIYEKCIDLVLVHELMIL